MAENYFASFDTPIGWLEVRSSDKTIREVRFLEEAGENSAYKPPVLLGCVDQFKEYFSGERREFELDIFPPGTNFQMKVWDELKLIPYGETISYLDLAIRVGDEKSTRAVAHANGMNPIPIIIPCHRVIGKDGGLIGYSGGIKRKQWLLDHEAKVRGIFSRLF